MWKLPIWLLIASAFTKTTCAPWTVDLPEVRYYFFEKFGTGEDVRNSEDPTTEQAVDDTEGRIDGQSNGTFLKANASATDSEVYNNVFSNSKHHENQRLFLTGGEVDEGTAGGHEEGEEGTMRETPRRPEGDSEGHLQPAYMERKVLALVRSGSQYLEGLRRALEAFTRRLESCSGDSNMRSSSNQSQSSPKSFTASAPQPTSVSPSSSSSPPSPTLSECDSAPEVSSLVRRLSLLAEYTTRRLQEREYTHPHMSPEEAAMEERELVLRLAWLLERLATLTGYEPEPRRHLASTTSRPQPTLVTGAPPALVAVSEDMKRAMLGCLAGSRATPATLRCAIPVTPQPALQPTGSPIAANQPVPVIGVTPGDVQPASSDQKSVVGASPPRHDARRRTVHKRSVSLAEDPLLELLLTYAKLKAWIQENHDAEEIIKQEDPFKINSVYDLVEKEINNKKPTETRGVAKVKDAFESLRKSFKSPLSDTQQKYKDLIRNEKSNDETGTKIHEQTQDEADNTQEHHSEPHRDTEHVIMKRKTNRYMYRIPEDPYQDISYYVKSKGGVRYRADPADAAQTRLSLEQAFRTGSIEVIRRYGSNYNPASVSNGYQGVLQSQDV